MTGFSGHRGVALRQNDVPVSVRHVCAPYAEAAIMSYDYTDAHPAAMGHYGGHDEEDEVDSDVLADRDFDDKPRQISPDRVAVLTTAMNKDGTLRKILKAKKSDFVHNLIRLDGVKFDFTGRDYLKPIYNRNDSQILLKTARQVEKCITISSTYVDDEGRERGVSTALPGNRLIGIGADGRQVVDRIVASEDNGVRPCVRIKTRLGSTLEVTLNHPLRKLMGWTQAQDLVVGDKIASLRTIGLFSDTHEPLAALLGLMTGDGCATEGSIRFTAKTPEVQCWFESLYDREPSFIVDKRSGTRNYYVSKSSAILGYLVDNGLFGKTAAYKVLPDTVFRWNRESTRELIRGLWATDGHCKNVHESKVDLVYCTTSPTLARQIRLLLRKFGVVTVIRENRPSNGGKLAYVIRVVTRRSIEAFHREIGPIPGKPFTIPEKKSNSNLDTLPKEIHDLVVAARKKSGHYWKRNGFQSKGLIMKRAYCPTFEKIAEMNNHLDDPALKTILDADIIWDEIISIEDIGEQPTWALQTETETFISDFVVNHNTTYLANNLTCDSIVINYNKSLYVSPSHTQTRQFSNEKLRPAIEKSPFIKKYFQDHSVSTQVFEKGFTNGSYIFLRSAFRSADRTRGISARNLCLDELQDFYISEIPVIMECTSHFPNARVLMAGTPKSFDNPIEIYWQATTQNEWLVPCGCGKWNYLDEQNIAPTEMYRTGKLPPGPVCKKCMRPLNVPSGRWVSFNSKETIQGYRIPQLMVPWICGLYAQWEKLLWKRDNYPFGQFCNEVLGISYDSASKPITRDDILACSAPYSFWDPYNRSTFQEDLGRYIFTAGIDWGEGNDGSEKSPSGKVRNASYTVLTIGGYIDQKTYKVFYMKRYTGKEVDPEFVVQDIFKLCQLFGVKLAGADWGHGWGVNNTLMRLLGANKLIQFQYLPKLKERLKWDPVGYRYHLQRNFMMSELFFDIKKGFIMFPRWSSFEPFAKDILAIYAEYNEYRREIKYDHRSSDPDDAFHSIHYARLASDIYLGKSRRYTQSISAGSHPAG